MSVGVVDSALTFPPTRPGPGAWKGVRTKIVKRTAVPKSDSVLKCVKLTDFKWYFVFKSMTKL